MNKRLYNDIIASTAYGATIEDAIRIISTEGVFLDVKNFLAKHLPSLTTVFENLKESVKEMVGAIPEDLKNFSREQRKIVQKLRQISYLEVSEILVPVPENFNGYFLDYLEEFEPMVRNSLSSCMLNLSEYRSYLALFMSTSDYKGSIRDMTPKYKSLETYRNQCVKTLNKYFPRDTGIDRMMLKKVVARLSDFEKLFDYCLKLDNVLVNFNIGEFKSMVDDCYYTLNLLNKDIDKENSQITMESIKNLSVGTYEIAKYVEFISSLYFDIVTIIRCITYAGHIIVNE